MACGPDISLLAINTNDTDEVENTLLPCEDMLSDGVIPYDKVEPGSIPLDVSYIDGDAIFYEVFTNYRDQIRAVFAIPLVGGSFHVLPTEITKTVDELEYTESPISFENGDFQVATDFGFYASIDGAKGAVLITNENCSALYGYAFYEFAGKNPDYETTMTSFLDENGDIIEL